MKNYCCDRIEMRTKDCVIIKNKMDELKKAGWKKVSFETFRTDMDNGCTIYGERPMTNKELAEEKRAEKHYGDSEYREMKRLAKKYGYKLVKEIADKRK